MLKNIHINNSKIYQRRFYILPDLTNLQDHKKPLYTSQVISICYKNFFKIMIFYLILMIFIFEKIIN